MNVVGQNMTCLPLSEINRMKNLIKPDLDPVKEKFVMDVTRPYIS